MLNRKMLLLFIFTACLAVTNAVVCFHGICDHIKKPDLQKCEGGVIKNGGFCGCYDVCAKVVCSVYIWLLSETTG